MHTTHTSFHYYYFFSNKKSKFQSENSNFSFNITATCTLSPMAAYEWERHNSLGHLLLPSRIHFSSKLKSETKPRHQPNHPQIGYRCFRLSFNHLRLTPAPFKSFLFQILTTVPTDLQILTFSNVATSLLHIDFSSFHTLILSFLRISTVYSLHTPPKSQAWISNAYCFIFIQ